MEECPGVWWSGAAARAHGTVVELTGEVVAVCASASAVVGCEYECECEVRVGVK